MGRADGCDEAGLSGGRRCLCELRHARRLHRSCAPNAIGGCTRRVEASRALQRQRATRPERRDWSSCHAVHCHAVPTRTRTRNRNRMAGVLPYTAHSCVNENVVATQRMTTCHSQCEGDPAHPMRGRTSATSSADFLATACLACRTRTSSRTAKPGKGQTPPSFGGPKGLKNPPRQWAHRMRITN
jgi:hypothetical protein